MEIKRKVPQPTPQASLSKLFSIGLVITGFISLSTIPFIDAKSNLGTGEYLVGTGLCFVLATVFFIKSK
jgi:hypothetical protein